MVIGVPSPDLTASYDDGYFDKDEQGWCARNVELTQLGERVMVRRWGDDNGLRVYDERLEGTVAAVLADRALVVLAGGLVGYVFDLSTRRLSMRGHTTREFTPPMDYLESAYHARAMQLLLDIDAALGGPVRTAPHPPPWPAPIPSPTCAGAQESATAIALPDGTGLNSMRRTLSSDHGLGPQLLVELRGGQGATQLFVEGPDRGQVLFAGPIEREPDADAVIERWRVT